MKRAHVYFSGMVQGVGFRYTAIRIARHAGVTGWARNLADGRVEIVAEGSQESLEQVVRELRDYFHSSVDHVELDWQEASGEFEQFDVRF